MSKRFCKGCNVNREWWEFSDNFKCCDGCRQKQRQKYAENPEKIKVKDKQYRETHKEQIAERKKQYNETHKEQLQAYRKEYMKLIHHCPICKYDVKFYKKAQHEKSQHHQEKLFATEIDNLKNIEIDINRIEDDDVKEYIEQKFT